MNVIYVSKGLVVVMQKPRSDGKISQHVLKSPTTDFNMNKSNLLPVSKLIYSFFLIRGLDES